MAACGNEASDGTRPHAGKRAGERPQIDLAISVNDGEGTTRRAALRCGDGKRTVSGFLQDHPGKLCRSARRLGPFLASRPERNRVCIQIYGGPETALIRGTVGQFDADRRFSRSDGCQIADWNRAVPLLPRRPMPGNVAG
jgi:hypothetical protein